MNFPQKIVLAVSAIVFTLMAMFPPWYFAFQERTTKLGERFAGYHPIWQANTPTDSAALSEVFSTEFGYDELAYFSIRLDTTRLGIQIVATVIVTLLLCAIFYGNLNLKKPANIYWMT